MFVNVCPLFPSDLVGVRAARARGLKRKCIYDLLVLSLFIFLLHWLQLFPLSGSNLRVDPDSVSFLFFLDYLSLPPENMRTLSVLYLM